MTDKFFNDARDLVNEFYERMRALEGEARESTERVYGRRQVLRAYNTVAELARAWKIATPPFRRGETNDISDIIEGRAISAPEATATEIPVYSPPAPVIVSDTSADSGKGEVEEFIRKRRKKGDGSF